MTVPSVDTSAWHMFSVHCHGQCVPPVLNVCSKIGRALAHPLAYIELDFRYKQEVNCPPLEEIQVSDHLVN